MCILRGNKTQIQAKTQQHDAHKSRPKQDKKRNETKRQQKRKYNVS